MTLYYQKVLKKSVRCSLIGLLRVMQKLSVKLDKRSPINCINQLTQTCSYSFKTHASKTLDHKDLVPEGKFLPYLATTFLYLGDLQTCAKILAKSHPLYLSLLLERSIDHCHEMYGILTENLKDFELKYAKDVNLIH
jgi:hypothetical protein